MNYSRIKLRERNYTALLTEIMFTVASERAVGTELIRLEIPSPKDKNDTKAYPAVTRILKSVKKKGIIQLYVPKEDLPEATTEAEYMMNKYESIISDDPCSEDGRYIYIKI